MSHTGTFPDTRGGRLLSIAARQHTLVTIEQVHELGLSTSAITSRLQRRQLHRIHRGVYAVGHPNLTREGRWLAAVLACGAGAVLSHRSAAALWGLLRAIVARVDVSVPRRVAPREGIRPHTQPLDVSEVTQCSGIPCTSVARTLVDLAAVVDIHTLERAVREAEVRRVFDLREVQRVLDRVGPRRGVAQLRTVLALYDPVLELARSELERRFLAICRRVDLPMPAVNAWIELEDCGLEVDFSWPSAKVAVETDGRRVHDTAGAFERDRRRDQQLLRAGWRVLRFTWRQVRYEPTGVATTLRAVLARGRDGAEA